MKRRHTLLLAGLLMVGCSPENLSEQVTKGAVSAGAEQLTREDTQQQLAEASRDPKTQEAMQNVTAQVTEGMLQALESPRAQQRVAELTRAVTQAAAQQMIAALSGDKTRDEIELLARGATDAALQQMAQSLRSDLGPAMRDLLEGDMARGLAAALNSKEMQDAIARESQTFAHNAVLGWNTGVRAAWTGQGGALQAARGLPDIGRTLLIVALVVLVLLTLIAISFAVMLVARARQARSEVARLESATLLLATVMREKQDTQQTDEILAVVQQALEGRAERTGKHRILDALRMRKTG